MLYEIHPRPHPQYTHILTALLPPVPPLPPRFYYKASCRYTFPGSFSLG